MMQISEPPEPRRRSHLGWRASDGNGASPACRLVPGSHPARSPARARRARHRAVATRLDVRQPCQIDVGGPRTLYRVTAGGNRVPAHWPAAHPLAATVEGRAMSGQPRCLACEGMLAAAPMVVARDRMRTACRGPGPRDRAPELWFGHHAAARPRGRAGLLLPSALRAVRRPAWTAGERDGAHAARP